jgi:hypothetical protein
MEGPAAAPENSGIRFPPLLRGTATLISVIFHPLFIPLYVTGLLIASHPIQFADFSARGQLAILGPVIENTIILPLAVVLLLKPLGFINSMRLLTQKDRIVPYVATMIFYYWLYRVSAYHSQDHEQFPALLCVYLLGNFIAVILAFLANIIMKISLHGIAMGSVIGILLVMGNDPYFNVSGVLMAAFLLAGLVATSRLILFAHRSREIYYGIALGIFAQLLAGLIF